MRAIVSALAVAAAAATIAPQIDRANLIVYKELRAPESQDILVIGRPFTVTYTALNVGKTPAFNVKVTDKFPSSSFELVSGVMEKSWAELASGANESFVVTLKPKVTGTLAAARASVDYQYKAIDEASGEEETVDVSSYSTTPGRVEIATETAYKRYTADYTRELSGFAAGAVIALLWPWRIWTAARATNAAARSGAAAAL